MAELSSSKVWGDLIVTNNIYIGNTSCEVWHNNNITGAISNLKSTNLTINKALISDANGKIITSTVTNVELGYLSGVTSAIQTQLNSKQASGSYLTVESDTLATVTGRGAITSVASTFNGGLTTTRLISTIATGTSPLAVTSTTLVSNLNADMIDGIHIAGIVKNDAGTPSIKSGLDAAKPAATGSGALYVSTDVCTLYRDAGVGIWKALNQVDFKSETGTHILSSDSATANINIISFNKDLHSLFVYQNGTYLQKNIDYTINADNTTITKISGVWLSGTVIDTVSFIISPVISGEIYNAADVLTKLKTVDGLGSGLDADMVDGLQAATTATVNTIVARDASGYIFGTYINSSRGDTATAAASYIYDTGDGYMRKKTLASTRSEIVTSTAIISGLGYTPYNNTNPNGYITSAHNHTGVYQPIGSYDNYVSWTLQGSGANGSAVTSGTVINIVGSGSTTVSKTGNTVTISSIDNNTWRSISDSVSTTDSTISASLTAVKSAYDLASSKWVYNAATIAGVKVSNAGYADNSGTSARIGSADGFRDLTTILPITNPNSVKFTFANAAAVGSTSSYAGLMTYSPWDGTSSSTGDVSYQLAFCSTVANGGTPYLRIRNGIDSTWNAWNTLWNAGNDGSGSGLDADLLDGNHATAFATAAQGVLATNALPKSGGALTGVVTAQNNAAYTTKQVRNIILSTGDAILGSMADGDIWVKYV